MTVTLAGLPAIVKLGDRTSWVKVAEVLAAKFESPAYAAVIEWVPTASVDVVKEAAPLVFSVAVPSEIVPSRKTTVPAGVPELEEVIVAVKVTGAPLDVEGAELSRAVVVAATAVEWMVSVTAAEVLAMKLESAPYAAVMECAPTVSVEVVKVATAALLSVPVPRLVVLSKKVTVPAGVPEVLEVIVAVKVTAAPLEAEGAELSKTAVVAARVTVSVTAGEVLAAKLASPL
jgi:hypothetical protein